MRFCISQFTVIVVWTITGCGSDLPPDSSSTIANISPEPRSEAKILSSQYGPIPPPSERSVCECGSVTEATFDVTAVQTDFDLVIGPRVERWERVYGPRVRIKGTTKYKLKGGGQVRGESFSISLIDDHGVDFQWPRDMDVKRVAVEGCLSRIYYPRDLSYPDTSNWKPDEEPLGTRSRRRISNNLRSWPFGFVYELRKFEYRFLDDERTGTD